MTIQKRSKNKYFLVVGAIFTICFAVIWFTSDSNEINKAKLAEVDSTYSLILNDLKLKISENRRLKRDTAFLVEAIKNLQKEKSKSKTDLSETLKKIKEISNNVNKKQEDLNDYIERKERELDADEKRRILDHELFMARDSIGIYKSLYKKSMQKYSGPIFVSDVIVKMGASFQNKNSKTTVNSIQFKFDGDASVRNKLIEVMAVFVPPVDINCITESLVFRASFIYSGKTELIKLPEHYGSLREGKSYTVELYVEGQRINF